MARCVTTCLAALVVVGSAGPLAGCLRVQLEGPAEPIAIKLDVTINQEVRLRLEDDVNELITTNPDLF